jgi:hypothetical protein
MASRYYCLKKLISIHLQLKEDPSRSRPEYERRVLHPQDAAPQE